MPISLCVVVLVCTLILSTNCQFFSFHWKLGDMRKTRTSNFKEGGKTHLAGDISDPILNFIVFTKLYDVIVA